MSQPLAVDISSTLQTSLDRAASVIARLVIFAIILLIGWLIARLLRKVTDRLLERLGFNRAAERSGLRRWTGRYRPGELVAKLVYYAVLLFTLQIAFDVFGPNPVSDLLESVVRWLPRAFVACVIIVVAAAIGNAVRDMIEAALGELSYGRLLARAVQIVIVALGAIAALNQIGVATTVTEPVLIAVLATIAGTAIVGLGGGLVLPMRERWERMLGHAERETTRAATTVRDRRVRQASAATAAAQSATAAAPPGYAADQSGYAPDQSGYQPGPVTGAQGYQAGPATQPGYPPAAQPGYPPVTQSGQAGYPPAPQSGQGGYPPATQGGQGGYPPPGSAPRPGPDAPTQEIPTTNLRPPAPEN